MCAIDTEEVGSRPAARIVSHARQPTVPHFVRENSERRTEVRIARLEAERLHPILADGAHIDEALKSCGRAEAVSIVDHGQIDALDIVAYIRVETDDSTAIEIEVREHHDEVVEIPVGLDELLRDPLAGRRVQLAQGCIAGVVLAVVLDDDDVTVVFNKARDRSFLSRRRQSSAEQEETRTEKRPQFHDLETAAQEPSSDPDFLDTIRIVEAKPAEGELTFTDLEGDLRTLREGDYLEEVDGARVKKISRTTLVLTRVVRGGDGQEGEALIVVRFDRSGKTKVREYRTVPDVFLKNTAFTERPVTRPLFQELVDAAVFDRSGALHMQLGD